MENEFNNKRRTQKIVINEQIKQRCEIYLSHTDVAQAYLDIFKYLEKRYKEELTKEIPLLYSYESGQVVGIGIDDMLPKFLSDYSIYTFKHGKVYEVDNVNIDNPIESCEGKTSSTGNFPVGSKTNAGLDRISDRTSVKYIKDGIHDNEHFCTFVSYRIDIKNHKYFIQDIWLGIIKPSDWKCSASNASSGATINSKIFYNKFLKIYDWQIGKLYNNTNNG